MEKTIKSNEELMTSECSTQLEWALLLNEMGLAVLPIRAGTKIPAIKWKQSRGLLSKEAIHKHWSLYPDHEVAILPGENFVVLDADSEASLNALQSLELLHGMIASIQVRTKKGVHHYYRIDEDVKVRAASYSTDQHSHAIDIRTGNNPVMGPGSTNKKVIRWYATCLSDITPVSQQFIDAVVDHNGFQRSKVTDAVSDASRRAGSLGIDQLSALLEFVESDDRSVWIDMGMALYWETSGDEEGYSLYDDWSSRSGKYRGPDDTRKAWQSFSGYVTNPITVASLISMAKRGGADVGEILEPFPMVVTEVVEGVEMVSMQKLNPLSRYCLEDMLEQYEKELKEEVLLFDGLVAQGETSVWWAAPNTGKTLIAVHSLIQSVKSGALDPDNVYYLNMDDNLRGLTQKLRLAREYGFHILAGGHKGFKASDFERVVDDLVESGVASGKIFILDTLTKFVNGMSKDESRHFASVLQRFKDAYGTVLALGHTNKNVGADGLPVYAGTSDISNEICCSYVLQVLEEDKYAKTRTVEFINRKIRGNVKLRAVYKYSTATPMTYLERLKTVQLIDVETLDSQNEVKEVTDDVYVEIVRDCIARGDNKKKDLEAALRTQPGVSKTKATALVDRYTEGVGKTALWAYSVGASGAHLFRLLDETKETSAGTPVSQVSGSPEPAACPVEPDPDVVHEEHEELEEAMS